MTPFELQKYLLRLNQGQRLSLLISIVNHFKVSALLSKDGLESLLKIYKPSENNPEEVPQWRKK